MSSLTFRKICPSRSLPAIPGQIKVILLGFVLFLAGGLLQGQTSRKDLEDRRKTLLREIETTNKLLTDTRKNREVTLNTYLTLQKQIEKRQQLINTLGEEIALMEQSIDRADRVVAMLAEDVGRLQEEYAAMARKTYRMKLGDNELLFLFSAGSFNEAFRRWRYLKQYDSYRQKQARLIEETRQTLLHKSEKLTLQRQSKEQLLLSEINQKDLLLKEISAKNNLLEDLKKSESKLLAELKDKQQDHERLTKVIERIIEAEVAKRAEEDRKRKEREVADSKADAAADRAVALSENFAQNKGKLPWPVSGGIVTRMFGKQAHPALDKILITNNGVDIQTALSAEVRSVFRGTVAGMQFIPGNNYMVIIRHGDFFTVYSNLEEVFVRRDQEVGTGQPIGKVGVDRISQSAELHFEVWRVKEREDPLKWLANK